MLYEFCTTLSRRQKGAILLAVDLLTMVVAFLLAQALLLGHVPVGDDFVAGLPFLAAMVAVGAGLTLHLGLHRIKLNAYEMQGLRGTTGVAAAMGAAGVVMNLLVVRNMPDQLFILHGMMFLILSVAGRLGLRSFVLWIYVTGKARKRVLIYGAGQTGQQLATALRTDDTLLPVAFVDDNPTLQSLTIAGLKVHSPLQLPQIVREQEIDRVVLAMPSAGRPAQARISRRLRNLGCEVQTLPSFAQLVLDKAQHRPVTRAELGELLGRSRMEEELPEVRHTYRGRSVLVTGAGGSIGAELCRQVVAAGPRRLVLLDHSEPSLFNVERELADMEAGVEIVPVLGSVCDKPLVTRVLSENDVDVVLHAAAYKHVVLVEKNSVEGLRNNVLATKQVADAARDAGVERFILISSDKAVRPRGIMGASKRFAELIVQDLATRSGGTRFSMVRFGNVLGSSGSVIPIFEEQIARGGPVTVTHADVTRYFMTVAEAVRLVLLAGCYSRGGDVFVLDMGSPVAIQQVARQMIEGAGYTVRGPDNPDGDIAIEFIGLRDGEKLSEELLIGSDMLTTPHPKILRAQENHLSELEMASALQDLRKAIEAQDAGAAASLVWRWIEKCDLTPRSTTINE
ncbi:MAG: polysaccharide biosynthesis protein [Rhodosalinus sp.]